MKKILLSIVLLPLFCGSTHAQITIDSADFGMMGDVVPVFRDTFNTGGLTITSGSSQSQSWDYSMLNAHLFDSIEFEDPLSYPESSMYPSANFVLPFALGDAFIRKTDTNMVILGLAGAGDDFGVQFPFTFNEPSTIIDFPSTLGSSYTESNLSVQTIPAPFDEVDSLIIQVDLQSFAECDAYGDLKTPAGEYTETLRQYVRLDFQIDVTAVLVLPIIGRVEQPVFDTTFSTHTYNWLTKDSTYTILEMAADERDGTVINATYQAGIKPLPVLSVDAVECPGDSNGAITVNRVVGGIPPYSYLWSTNETQSQVSNLTAGVYFVTVYDSQNDSTVTRVEMNTNDSINVDESISAPSGSGLEDGGVVLDNVNGGQPPYLFSWSNGSQMRNLEDVAPGVYTVTITDFNGCIAEFSFEVPGAVSTESLTHNYHTKVYPVPFDDLLNISSDQRVGEVRVFDVTGTLVRTVYPRNTHYRMNTSDLSPGFYLLKITNDSGSESVKRVVKR